MNIYIYDLGRHTRHFGLRKERTVYGCYHNLHLWFFGIAFYHRLTKKGEKECTTQS